LLRGWGMTSCVYYVVAGTGSTEPAWPTEKQRSHLCDAIARAVLKSHAIQPRLEILAYCVDELWLRAVLEVQNARGVRRFLGLIRDECEPHGAHDSDAGRVANLFAVVQYVRLNTIEDQLLAVRHCHLAPVQLGLVEHPEDWPWSSHLSYCEPDRTPGLHRGSIARALAGGPGGWPLAYAYLMGDIEPGDGLLRLPTLNLVPVPKAERNGDRTCLQVLSAHSRERNRERIFKAVVVEVCDNTGCDPDEFMADPAARRFRLQRALVLEEFTVRRRGLINVHDLAGRLHVDRSWLYQTRRECRLQRPELFARESESMDGHTLNGPNLHEHLGSGQDRSQDPWRQWHISIAAIAYRAPGVSVQVNVAGKSGIDLSALLAGPVPRPPV
jgi:hypothetical protein